MTPVNFWPIEVKEPKRYPVRIAVGVIRKDCNVVYVTPRKDQEETHGVEE